jgi:prophage regulatory protein
MAQQPTSFDDLPRSVYLREHQFLRTPNNRDTLPVPLIPIAPSTWWRWVREGRAPQPKKLGDGVTAWNVGELRDWLASREAA